jgi:DNA-binding NtrC family response regulator
MARILMIAPEQGLLQALSASPLLEEHEVEAASGDFDALRRLRHRGYAVLITAPATSLDEDLAFLEEIRAVRPGVRIVVLARHTTPEAVIAALRKEAFACFSAPFDAPEIADMVARAAQADAWKDGIAVVSAKPDWISVKVNCRLLSAERLLNFFGELRSDVPESPRDDLLFAFREVLMNAMEHGGKFDPDQVV